MSLNDLSLYWQIPAASKTAVNGNPSAPVPSGLAA